MNRPSAFDNGIEVLVDQLRKEFRCPENRDYYDEDDFREAEKKYVKYRLSSGT